MALRIREIFQWQPSFEEFVAPLRLKKDYSPAMERYSKGIDNAHIDVLLSTEFIERAELLIRFAMNYDVAVNYWGESPTPPSTSDLKQMLDAYTKMMEGALQQASKANNTDLIQLLQFSVVKFLLHQIRVQFRFLKAQVKKSGDAHGGQSTTQSVRVHERMVTLSKEEPVILYRVNRYIFRELLKLENTRLSKLRKSLLGKSWPVPRPVLFNPILLLPSIWSDELVMKHYTLVCIDQGDPDRFSRANKLVLEPFKAFLPEWAQPRSVSNIDSAVDGDSSVIVMRDGSQPGRSLGFAEIERLLRPALQEDELESGLISWLDSPENFDQIIYSSTTPSVKGESASKKQDWDGEKWLKFHDTLLKRIYKYFQSKGLEQEILACHAAVGLYTTLQERLPVRVICHYLSGQTKRKDLQRRLSSMQTVSDPAGVLKTLDLAVSAIRSSSLEQRQKRVFSFLRHFALLRRDLKLAYQAYHAMGQIRLLSGRDDIELSRNNKTLYQFAVKDQGKSQQKSIRDHVILKADVRGSTAMIAQLREKSLNPASHFSLNFFDPITNLLGAYGAKKVFVEGDAVILSVIEYEDTPYQWMCVSHACGLAMEIMKVVDLQNAKNNKYGLPPLELGLGIAFSDQAPTFLYDEDREIMISPAINRSDQLSSCSSALKRSAIGKKLGRGVEVFSPTDDGIVDKQTSDRLMRYNVNGIELDMPAFYKLKSELVLKEAEVNKNGRYLVGRFPDLEGKMHWLVVREGIVFTWDGERIGQEESKGRRFYQVITDQQIIRRMTGHINDRNLQS